jgi:hypothetical protein
VLRVLRVLKVLKVFEVLRVFQVLVRFVLSPCAWESSDSRIS